MHEFPLERELSRDGGDLDLPHQAIDAIHDALRVLERHPYTCRKVGNSPFWRELVIALGSTGYVAQFEIASDDRITVGAIRHQREDDYY